MQQSDSTAFLKSSVKLEIAEVTLIKHLCVDGEYDMVQPMKADPTPAQIRKARTNDLERAKRLTALALWLAVALEVCTMRLCIIGELPVA